MGAEKAIILQALEHKRNWEDLFWAMSDGNILAYKEIKRMDVFDFWGFFDRWRAKQKEEADKLKRRK